MSVVNFEQVNADWAIFETVIDDPKKVFPLWNSNIVSHLVTNSKDIYLKYY